MVLVWTFFTRTYLPQPLPEPTRPTRHLPTGRLWPNQKAIFVVAGGTDGHQGPLNSTEIWYPNSNEGWINGKNQLSFR